MALCYDNYTQRYEYCSANLSTYIAVGVLIPIGILLIIALVYFYLKCRQRQLRRQQQQTYMTTIIPIYSNEGGHPIPYNYSYPPRYTSLSEEAFDKPPSYEQTIQEVPSETNNNNVVENSSPAILPVTTASSELPIIESTRNQS